ncbi:DMT family transporter [Marinigracilibium pacificum]|uniref:DMT family transporter n=1 Tax=Marinigracilibium pacificum TaxID=2729599 RepID=A0A848IX88_9BACT|nr:DMT family transporter [Marinigracilibium pacificum]NMM46870.1 DMT family transporter [Marinigracilibium pacificum]
MKEDQLPSGPMPWLLLVILTLIWGSSFILIKKALLGFNAPQVGALRVISAGIVLLPIALIHLRKVKPKDYLPLFVPGFTGTLLPAFFFAIAQTRISSGVTGVLNALTPMFTLIIGVLIWKKKALRTQLLGLLLGFIGSVFLIIAGESGAVTINSYAFFVMAATLCYGINLNFIKSRLYHLHPVTITSVSLAFVLPIAVIYIFTNDGIIQYIMTNEQAQWSLLSVSVLGIVGTAIALVIFNHLVQLTSPVFTSTVTYFIPIVAIIWGLWDGENLYLLHYIGMVGILGGVYLVNKKPKLN